MLTAPAPKQRTLHGDDLLRFLQSLPCGVECRAEVLFRGVVEGTETAGDEEVRGETFLANPLAHRTHSLLGWLLLF